MTGRMPIAIHPEHIAHATDYVTFFLFFIYINGLFLNILRVLLWSDDVTELLEYIICDDISKNYSFNVSVFFG